jgi:hypothetical protein
MTVSYSEDVNDEFRVFYLGKTDHCSKIYVFAGQTDKYFFSIRLLGA